MLEKVKEVYRKSLKPKDSLFNLYVARPLAAPIVVALEKTPITPNQVTFLSITCMCVAVALYCSVSGWLGLLLGTLALECAYLLDCTDGQLARLTGRSSPVGAALDFLMDELKAFLLIGALSARGYWQDEKGAWILLVGLGSAVVVGAALSMTQFLRCPAYAAFAESRGQKTLKHGEAAGAARSSKLWPIEMAIRVIQHYPAGLPIFAAFNRLDLFLCAYGGVHVLYLGKSALAFLPLCRFAPASKPSPAQSDALLAQPEQPDPSPTDKETP